MSIYIVTDEIAAEVFARLSPEQRRRLKAMGDFVVAYSPALDFTRPRGVTQTDESFTVYYITFRLVSEMVYWSSGDSKTPRRVPGARMRLE